MTASKRVYRQVQLQKMVQDVVNIGESLQGMAPKAIVSKSVSGRLGE